MHGSSVNLGSLVASLYTFAILCTQAGHSPCWALTLQSGKGTMDVTLSAEAVERVEKVSCSPIKGLSRPSVNTENLAVLVDVGW